MEGGKDIKAAGEERGAIMIELPNLSLAYGKWWVAVQFFFSF